MKLLHYSIYLVLLTCIIISCEICTTKPCPKPTPEIIYFNSFESIDDTTGWFGIAEDMFVADPAPGGGNQSVCIEGGCLQPAAYIDLPQQTEDGYYTISCWGKIVDESQTGQVLLTTTQPDIGPQQGIKLQIDNLHWSLHESADTLFCPENYNLRIELHVGGYIPAQMLVDCIKIEKVE